MIKIYKNFFLLNLIFSNLLCMQKPLFVTRKISILHILCSTFDDPERIKEGYELRLKPGKYYKDRRFSENEDFYRDLNSLDELGNTPLFSAIKSSCSSWRLVQFLIKYGANVNIINDFEHTPLFYCLANPNFNFDVLLTLLKEGAVLNLEVMLKNESALVYKKLVDKFLDYQDEAGNTVLFYAQQFCCESLVGFIKYFSELEEEPLDFQKTSSCSNCNGFASCNIF